MGIELPARLNGGVQKGVIDGDTFEVVVKIDKETAEQIGMNVETYSSFPVEKEWTVRSPDLDTHEMKTEKGKKERKWAVGWFREAVNKKNRGNDKPVNANMMAGRCDNSHGDQSGFYLTLYTPMDTVPTGQYGRKLLHTYRDFDGDKYESSILTRFGSGVGWYD